MVCKTDEGGIIISKDCVDIISTSADPTRNFYRVRFRNPKLFVGGKYSTPQWGQKAAMTIGTKYYGVKGCKITMAQPVGGRWMIQSVLIPKNGGVEMNEELALKIANHIQDRIEREGEWTAVMCRDNETKRYISKIKGQHIERDERGRFAPHAAEEFGAESNFEALKQLKKRWSEDFEHIGITYEEMLVGEIYRLRNRLTMKGFDPHAKIGSPKYAEEFGAEGLADKKCHEYFGHRGCEGTLWESPLVEVGCDTCDLETIIYPSGYGGDGKRAEEFGAGIMYEDDEEHFRISRRGDGETIAIIDVEIDGEYSNINDALDAICDEENRNVEQIVYGAESFEADDDWEVVFIAPNEKEAGDAKNDFMRGRRKRRSLSFEYKIKETPDKNGWNVLARIKRAESFEAHGGGHGEIVYEEFGADSTWRVNTCTHRYEDTEEEAFSDYSAWKLRDSEVCMGDGSSGYVETGVRCDICGQERIGSWAIENENEGFQITKGEEGRMPRSYGWTSVNELFGAEGGKGMLHKLFKEQSIPLKNVNKLRKLGNVVSGNGTVDYEIELAGQDGLVEVYNYSLVGTYDKQALEEVGEGYFVLNDVEERQYGGSDSPIKNYYNGKSFDYSMEYEKPLNSLEFFYEMVYGRAGEMFLKPPYSKYLEAETFEAEQTQYDVKKGKYGMDYESANYISIHDTFAEAEAVAKRERKNLNDDEVIFIVAESWDDETFDLDTDLLLSMSNGTTKDEELSRD